MQVIVSFRHFEADDAVRAYAKEKILKVKKYLERPVEARVVLSVEKFRSIAEATISGDGFVVNGVEKTDDMYSAIDRLVDKLERQVRRRRDKTKSRRSGASPENQAYRMNVLSSERPETGHQARIVTSEEYWAKPMSLDEAILQLDAGEDDFLVFINSESGALNVVHQRKDGNYGLIEAELR
jgi:putative sigma-54 modulation protein